MLVSGILVADYTFYAQNVPAAGSSNVTVPGNDDQLVILLGLQTDLATERIYVVKSEDPNNDFRNVAVMNQSIGISNIPVRVFPGKILAVINLGASACNVLLFFSLSPIES
jgi:hypothetical protein